MKRVLKSRLTILAALAVVAAGCGGGGSNPVPSANGGVNFSGAETVPTTASSDAVIPATGGVVVSSGEGDVVVPSGSGATVTAGSDLATLPAGVGLLGSFAAGSTLTVNGVTNSGLSLGTDGLSDQASGFPVADGGTNYTLAFPAGTLDTTRALTVGSFVLTGRWYVRPTLSIPVPISLSGTIPQNGQNAVGADVVATFLPGCNNRSATLTVTYGNGFVLQQTRTIAANQVRFTNFTTDSVSIPAGGVQEVRLSVGPL